MPAELLPDDAHDRALRGHVHPPDWINPEPRERYSLVVLGGGTAGLVAAAGAAGLGARVALVERDLLGGDCLNVGCVPSKGLIAAARAMAGVRGAGEFGVRVPEGAAADFPAVMERMRRLRAGIAPHDSAARFRDLGVDVFLGQGTFTGPDAVEVGGRVLRFAKALIATGGRPQQPDIPGLREAGFLTNENVFTLTELPRRLAVIGAGPIGCELAQAFARLGAEVHLVGKHPHLLPREDADAARLLEEAFRREGIHLHLGCEVARIDKEGGTPGVLDGRGGDRTLHLAATVEGREPSAPIRVDAVLVAAGRVPNVEGLGLEAAGIAYDRGGVVVDDRLRTTNKRVFAAGDVCSRFKFTHAADALARIALRNALFLGRARASNLIIPWCTYTEPEIAHLGLSEQEAREKNVAVRVFRQEIARVDRAVLDGEDAGFFKVLTPPKSDRILGATIVGPHAGDLIGEVVLAMQAGVGLGRVADVVHPYPTLAEAFKKIGDAYNRTRLTPWTRWLLRQVLKWTGGSEG